MVPSLAPVTLFGMYSFWVPQIWRNATRRSLGVDKTFVIGTTIGRLAIPICTSSLLDLALALADHQTRWAAPITSSSSLGPIGFGEWSSGRSSKSRYCSPRRDSVLPSCKSQPRQKLTIACQTASLLRMGTTTTPSCPRPPTRKPISTPLRSIQQGSRCLTSAPAVSAWRRSIRNRRVWLLEMPC